MNTEKKTEKKQRIRVYPWQIRGQKALGKQRLDDGVSGVERGVELRGVLAAGLGHVRTSAARAADLLRDLSDDLAGLHAVGEVFGDADDDGDASSFFVRGA